MRLLTTSIAVLGLLCLAPFVAASAGPMEEAELIEISTHIVHGEITEVVCDGETVYVPPTTSTAYLATLTVTSVTAPEGVEITTMTLPFASVVYDEGAAQVSCGGGAWYEVGQKGLFYLMQAATSDMYTLTSLMSGFVADEDSDPQPGPVCDVAEPDPATELGQPCEDAEDCESGWCIEGADGHVCSQACLDDCPEGWSCEDAGAEGDPAFVCQPEVADPSDPGGDDPGDEDTSDGGSGGDSDGGCAGGGSSAPVSLALLALCLLVPLRRSRCLS